MFMYTVYIYIYIEIYIYTVHIYIYISHIHFFLIDHVLIQHISRNAKKDGAGSRAGCRRWPMDGCGGAVARVLDGCRCCSGRCLRDVILNYLTYTYIYIYIFTTMHIYTYIQLYISIDIYNYTFLHIYIYIHAYI